MQIGISIVCSEIYLQHVSARICHRHMGQNTKNVLRWIKAILSILNLSDSVRFVTPKIALSDDVPAETRCNQILVHVTNNLSCECWPYNFLLLSEIA
jgi:hypothetical protein